MVVGNRQEQTASGIHRPRYTSTPDSSLERSTQSNIPHMSEELRALITLWGMHRDLIYALITSSPFTYVSTFHPTGGLVGLGWTMSQE